MQLWAQCKKYGLCGLVLSKGILIGRPVRRAMSKVELEYFEANGMLVQEEYILEYPQIVVNGAVFRMDDNVIVCNPDSSYEWLCKFHYAFVASTTTGWQVCFSGLYYRINFYTRGPLCGCPEMDASTGMMLIAPTMENYDFRSIQPAQLLMREVCILPGRDDRTTSLRIAFETVTTSFPERLLGNGGAGHVPVFPVVGDVVEVHNNSSARVRRYAEILGVNRSSHEVSICWLRREDDILFVHFKEKQPQSWDSIVKVLNVTKFGRGKQQRFVLFEED